MNPTEKENKLKDIAEIDFGTSVTEIASCMEVLVMMIDIDDDEEVVFFCKNRLKEGIELLKSLGQTDIEQFESI